MKRTVRLASIGMLAAILGNPVLAGDRPDRQERDRDRSQVSNPRASAGLGMQLVPHSAGVDERAYDWQFFSDPEKHRAVVISPQGDYYYSRGKGLKWVAAAQAGL